ncbi:uncharacterized protein EV422DRAFT_565695 [Fimicolochytrium jonesii]|uniref:uncharacterized protein n=1 Tax=Fimicolochytrium jonesii TaxID=1396493 RepID=UPI0022FDD2FA|nr:uncharacterized protein EV422DRAFT_565695 [Fimicolochytrium jonesii]KAI8823781.1 hypothetical protein EV422DRAFT_565695 [Fimicolochytrium jonesii]
MIYDNGENSSDTETLTSATLNRLQDIMSGYREHIQKASRINKHRIMRNAVTVFASQVAGILSNGDVFEPAVLDTNVKRAEATIDDWIQRSLGIKIADSTHVRACAPQGSYETVKSALNTALNAAQTNTTLPDPVIYITDDVQAKALEYALTTSMVKLRKNANASVRRVPTLPDGDSMDLKALENLIVEDIANRRRPFFVVARLFSYVTEEVSDLDALRRLCDSEGLWLHVEGNFGPPISNRACNYYPSEAVESTANSYAIHFAQFFGHLPVPSIVLSHRSHSDHRREIHEDLRPPSSKVVALHADPASGRLEPTEHLYPALQLANNHEDAHKLQCTLALFVATQVLSLEYFMAEFNLRWHALETFTEQVHRSPSLKLLSDTCHSSLLIRFDSGDAGSPTVDTSAVSLNRGTKHIYLEMLRALPRHPAFDLLGISSTLYIRWSLFPHDPLTTAEDPTPAAHLSLILSEAENIHTAISLQDAFRQAVNTRKELEFIEDSANTPSGANEETGEVAQVEDDWIGLGAVRYTPLYIDTNADSIATEVVDNLDGLNSELTEKLQLAHADETNRGLFTRSFALSEYLPSALRSGSGACVRVGLTREPHTTVGIQRIVDAIVREGMLLERDSAFVARIADVIKKGIEEAERQLQNESEEEQPSLLRMLPLVGSVLSWWRPETPKNRVPVARTFSIATGFTTIPLVDAPASSRPSISLSRMSSLFGNGGFGGAGMLSPAISSLSTTSGDEGMEELGKSFEGLQRDDGGGDGRLGRVDETVAAVAADVVASPIGGGPTPVVNVDPKPEVEFEASTPVKDAERKHVPVDAVGEHQASESNGQDAIITERPLPDPQADLTPNENNRAATPPPHTSTPTVNTPPFSSAAPSIQPHSSETTAPPPDRAQTQFANLIKKTRFGEASTNPITTHTHTHSNTQTKSPAHSTRSSQPSSGRATPVEGAGRDTDVGNGTVTVEQVTDEMLEEGVRGLLEEYEGKLDQLNNRKVRMHLQDRFGGVDLKPRISAIREMVDRCLEERG